ncbi:phosphoribosylglycinamide formyltransferase [Mesorhizobium sp. RMAD-H1]|uniref:phosphoribosylglycinamide formyltransferase n=1 Tax=Mesorhizobium sp. RMAD-H1 TaxID=2587065 RepID=UPI00161285B9|nr:phosphoribosylglycinamide formyltransferase [Mesorhizobium sp. RMAD-H1]MBB2970430.1 formyltetrahydrofolate-dependent phosphoribosylglycinamide formyltransferase [Mesorhizobium sp. RMAD-H1]
MTKKRVAVLISGRGSNMTALIEACKDPAYPAEIVAVLSNKPDAAGLEVARSHGIETVAVPQKDYASRAAHEEAINAELARVAPDIICLAGYMRLMSADFVARWEGRMINIHPSLLPLFKGLDSHARVLESGMRVHGCTVHFVTAEMDGGPIIAQAVVPVEAGDTEDTLSARVLTVEHKLYPLALKLVAEGKVRMEDGRIVCSSLTEGDRTALSAF